MRAPKLFLAIAFVTAATTAHAASLAPERLLDICSESTIAEAQAKGDALGWQRMTDDDFRAWRDSFTNYNKGQVEVVGWRGRSGEKGDSLSYWIARGPNTHRACAYSTSSFEGLLESLTRVLGAPKTLDRQDLVTTAGWDYEGAEIYYSQVGTAAQVSIAYQQ